MSDAARSDRSQGATTTFGTVHWRWTLFEENMQMEWIWCLLIGQSAPVRGESVRIKERRDQVCGGSQETEGEGMRQSWNWNIHVEA